MLTKADKDKIIETYKTHKDDTGSPEVQIAILSAEILDLTEHLKQHKKDNFSQRKKLVSYLHKEDEARHAALIKKLGIKG